MGVSVIAQMLVYYCNRKPDGKIRTLRDNDVSL